MDTVIKVQNLSKNYGSKKVIDGISFDLKEGEIYGLIGRNGAGKTTIMKILLGLTEKSTGDINILGSGVGGKGSLKIGSIIETPTFYENESAYDNMVHHALLIGMKNYKEEIDRLLDEMGLLSEKKNKVKKFSLGMKQKLGIAMAMMNNPKILILDEPINGLDPVAIAEVRKALKKIVQENKATILISSHILGEMQKLATRYGFIRDGKLVKEITEEEVESQGIDLEELSLKMMGVED